MPDLTEAERLSLARWRPGDPSWLTVTQVGVVLGVSQPRVSQLTDSGLLPCEQSADGRRLYRRQ